MNGQRAGPPWRCLSVLLMLVLSAQALAHHAVGRPQYTLAQGEGGTARVEIQLQIGAYAVHYLAAPALPQPGQSGRVELALTAIADRAPYRGEVSFHVRTEGWFGGPERRLVEPVGDESMGDVAAAGVYRQGFVFSEQGAYTIIARFASRGQPYTLEFPLQVGNSSAWPALLIAIGLVVLLLLLVRVLAARRRCARAAADNGD